MNEYTTYTASGLPRYNIELSHSGLNKFRHFKNENLSVARQMALAQQRTWESEWAAKKDAERRQKDKYKAISVRDGKKELAAYRTLEAQEVLSSLDNLLNATLAINDAIDWNSLRDHSDYLENYPSRPHYPSEPQPKTKIQYSREPLPNDAAYKIQIGILEWLFPARRKTQQAIANWKYENAHKEWQRDCEKADSENIYNTKQLETELIEWQESKKRIDVNYLKECENWDTRKKCFLEEQEAANKCIDEREAQYRQGNVSAIVDYVNMVLANSKYPDYFPRQWEVDYIPETKICIVDYCLPSPDMLPRLKEVKYIQSRDAFEEKFATDNQHGDLYDKVIYQITLRTIHELFESDKIHAIEAVSFNGIVTAIDKSTGQEVTSCIVSIQAKRDEFIAINLANIDFKACFKKLKGVGSSKLYGLAAIPPIMKMQRDDERFIQGYSVVNELDQGYNLATMDWEDFEHLIRELFEEHFSKIGGEVKVTRASRDRGVDAVVFDPDPIRGGKIVIQAKRYVGVVGVDAVRDLYGTVINEGAIKGILITTSEYGPDSYAFAKEKPLTLMNGSNLLHLLQEHGHKARIDLKEAKEILGAKGGQTF